MTDFNEPITPEDTLQRKEEWRMFMFIIIFLFPILTVMFVGSYGFIVWMYQLLAGPPGSSG
ncbi:periplasmic nitrate reductase, NapE protein [Pseudomaricurvus hydrocarbonicus]|uniref:periplasmic nitrate reductase, NapE protein n=1 Tax=Pseudomaricurvus hydrocarbonicus TaxID=1470433 RepID=UPI00312CB623